MKTNIKQIIRYALISTSCILFSTMIQALPGNYKCPTGWAPTTNDKNQATWNAVNAFVNIRFMDCPINGKKDCYTNGSPASQPSNTLSLAHLDTTNKQLQCIYGEDTAIIRLPRNQQCSFINKAVNEANCKSSVEDCAVTCSIR